LFFFGFVFCAHAIASVLHLFFLIVLIADGWCPRDRVEEVHETVARVARNSGAGVPVMCNPVAHTETPPTHFITNKFTFAFNHIVEAYGVARYQEVNPSVFTLITFPFLFGVMFGDVGHGTIMLIFSSFLIYKEKTFLQMRLNEVGQSLCSVGCGLFLCWMCDCDGRA
jgi:V-type H+-transporting ATPase subunit a